ncbi:MAG: beta-L-arabinofuranosidase domain-containing protein [Phycisphaerae bacterium]
MKAGFVVRLIVLGLAPTTAFAADAEKGPVTFAVVRVPTTAGANAFYVGNRPPLLPNPLIKLPIGAIMPKGWLREQLLLEADGMSGHLSEISKWCKPEGSAWMNPRGEGRFGWEELPYWLKGFGDLGYVLRDDRIIREARSWIDAILASQEPSGYFGPRVGKTAIKDKPDLWPNMLILNALQSFYEVTGDPRVIPFMLRYFRYEFDLPRADLFPESWQKIRAGDNLESVYWVYNRTGEAWLLDLARVIHERTTRWDLGPDVDRFCLHGVNFAQGFREPAEYYMLSRNRADLDATERNYMEMRVKWGQIPGGMYGADENCRNGFHGPRQGAETCAIVEMMHSDEMLLKLTGDPMWADRCEDVALNTFPPSMTPDLKALHYITSPNVVQLDAGNKAPGLENSGCMLAYSPDERYRCCQHNVAMGWPYYAEHLWTATRDNGLAAVLYAASEVKAKVGDGAEVTIAEATDYPFEETVVFVLSTPRPVRFPLYLRVPRWCEAARVSVNGEPAGECGLSETTTASQTAAPVTGAALQRPRPIPPLTYVRIDRTWSDGDKVRFDLPMRIEVKTWRSNGDSVSVYRGPLAYSLRIGEKWVKSGRSERWPDWEVFPTTPWNYGLLIDAVNPASSFRVVRKPGPVAAQPFTPDAAPIELIGHGRRIPAWQMDELGLVGPLQASPAKSDQPVEQVTLIPMGCARLRISAFPTIGEGPDAHEWTVPPPSKHHASHVCNDINALSDGRIPKASNDDTIPRFTWWDHKGTSEWVSWTFEKPRRVSACEVYWFADTGRGQCRVPASWKVVYRAGGQWREVPGASAYECRPDQFNRVTFEPVEADALRIEVQLQKGFSGGILEWMIE